MKKDSGFFTLDAMGGMLVMIVLLPVLNGLWTAGVNMQKKKAVAEHFMAINQAAIEYGKQNHFTLLPQSGATSGPAVTIANLKAAGVLPDRSSEFNAWGQGYSIASRLDSNGALAMVVLTTGGQGEDVHQRDFANVMVPEAAAMARAGYIPTSLISPAPVLRGAYGAWELPLADIGMPGTAGHLGVVSTFSAADTDQDLLYRIAVPGRPELNAMQTNLDMTGHAIDNVGSIGFTSKDFSSAVGFCTGPEDEGRTFLDREKGLYLCRNGAVVLLTDTGNSLMVHEKTLGWHGMLLDKPVCPEGAGLHPEIFVSQAMLAAGNESPPMAAFQAWATDYSDTQWQVNLRIKTSKDEWIYPGPNYGRLEVTTTCAR